MSFLERFKKKKEDIKKPLGDKPAAKQAKDESLKKEVKKVEEKKVVKPTVSSEKKEVLKGKTGEAYRILIKPLVTEKASELGALNKYVFEVNAKMNKIEIKKAIRSIYKVDPINVRIINFSGKNVRFGRTSGKTKGWKKAIVTLKTGDKIEIYEGV